MYYLQMREKNIAERKSIMSDMKNIKIGKFQLRYQIEGTETPV